MNSKIGWNTDMSGFIWQFLSKFGGFRTQKFAQRVLKDRELLSSENAAWKKVCQDARQAMTSKDPEVVKKVLSEATSYSHVDEKAARVLTANLRGKLADLQKSDKNKPPFI